MGFDEPPPRILHHGAHDPGALLTAAQDRALDMDALPMGRVAFVPTSLGASLIRLDAGPARHVELHGSFTFAGGVPSGGTVTAVRLVENGVTVIDLSNLPGDAVELFQGLVSLDPHEVEHVLFGGADDVGGSPFGDTLTGHGGDDTLMGGAGADYVRGLGDGDFIDGGAGDDDLNGNTGVDVVKGGDGADIVRGGQDGDYVFGDGGDDPHLNGNLGDDEVFGGAGADTLFGGQGGDMLWGDDGDDQLSGDLGADILAGGAGADRFLFRAGSGMDWVADFDAAEGDRVQLAPGVGFTLTLHEGQVVIDLGGGDRLGLAGVGAVEPGLWLVVA